MTSIKIKTLYFTCLPIQDSSVQFILYRRCKGPLPSRLVPTHPKKDHVTPTPEIFRTAESPENPRWRATSADRATPLREVRVGRVPSTWPILLRFCVEDLCRHARQQPQLHGAWFWKYPALPRTFASFFLGPCSTCVL